MKNPKKTPKKSPGRKKKTTAKQVKETKALITSPRPKYKEKKEDDDAIEGEVMDNPEGKDRFGRPTVVTEEVKQKLLDAFAYGCSNKEAARYAGIAERTLDHFNKKDPEFKEFSEELKQTPIFELRMALIKAAKKSPYFALKCLERLKADEWSMRVIQTFEEPEPLSPEEREALNDVIDDNL